MRTDARGRRWAWLVLMALSVVPGACSTDQGGHLFTAINQSDRDLVVQVDSDAPEAILLPAHSRSTVGSGWSYFADWTLTVMDTSCVVVGSIRVVGPGTVLTIASDGTLKVDANRSAFDTAAEHWKTDRAAPNCPPRTPSPR